MAATWSYAAPMCNAYEQHVTHAAYLKAMRDLDLATPSAETAADLPQADEIRIGDPGPVLIASGNGAELRQMKFGFPPPRKGAGPIFNFKSDGRHFKDSRRCLVILSGFFEFTGSKYPKAKHRFTLNGSPLMAIAGLWSEAEDGALSFTMLTTTPGPDIAPYHDRQVVVLRPAEWAAWLFLTRPEEELLRPLPAGSLLVETVRPESK
jgi:putative SOS response-associated peptidase YedK